MFILYSTKFMICYWSEHYMAWPSLWFVAGQNTVCYDQVYDLALVRTLYVTTSIWLVTGQNTVCYDQVYDLLLVRTQYVTTKLTICYWSERCMLRLIIVTYKLTAVFILYSTKFMICYRSERHMLRLVIVTNQLTSCVYRST